MTYQERTGDLIELTKQGKFDVVVHGCNCFCVQGAGLALQMAKHFGTDNAIWFPLESKLEYGNINKLGQIEYLEMSIVNDVTGNPVLVPYSRHYGPKQCCIVNAYTQFRPGPNLEYSALRLCMKKLNHIFKGKHIGLPKIGCGIAAGDWSIVQQIIRDSLYDCNVTIVSL